MRPIGKTTLFLLLSLLLPTLCVTTAWADILDDCGSTSGPGSYQNLGRPGQDFIRWSDPPDDSYLTMQSNRRTASVVYRCSDAQEVTVGIYSRYGSYAGYRGGELVRGGDELPLRYQSSTGEVYCDGRRMAYDADLRDFVFLEEGSRPSGLTEYGLSVYCSRDGSDYTQVSTRLLSAWQEGPSSYWYEEYQAQLEEGTRYLRLVLTDQSDIQILGRESRLQFDIEGGLSLAWVEIIEGTAQSREGDRDTEIYWDTADSDGLVYSENIWETQDPGTGGLPSYQPGEEQGPASLPWGPEEDPSDGGPAFPEETGDQTDASTSRSGSSSKSPASSSEAASGQGGSRPATGQNGQNGQEDAPSAPAAPAEVGISTPAPRQEAPLWRRAADPDAMTMLIIALILIVMGVRILWEGSGGNKRRQREAWEREQRYARYTDPDAAPPYDRGGRERETGRPARDKQPKLHIDDWIDPDE